AIVSSCESAGRDGSESEREALAFARKSALEGGRLAKSIASGGKKAPDGRRAVNLCEILGEIREIAAHALPPSISLEIFVSGGLPKVDADPSWLKQALLNLIINARDALEGVEGAKISVEAQPLGASKALVRVSDNGPGVEVSLRERIFTPFFTTKGSGKGSGLGLAISRALIEKEGGSLTLAQSGAGAAFEMILPAAPPRDAKILVVDPDPVSRALLADALAARGFEAQLAADGKEALALLSEGGERYAGLVTELLLPGAGPKTLLREAFSKNVNAMVLTSVELDEAREGALKAGARAFCLKPLDSVALSKWLETI
ncbi:response regulator, partial [bacterium]